MLHRVRLSLCIALVVAGTATGTTLCRAQIVFEPPRLSDGGGLSTYVVAGDFDGDAVPDAIVSHFPIFTPTPVPIFAPGLGDGGFGAYTSIPLDASRVVQAAADFDEDGNLDLVTLPAIEGSVAVALGDGRGGFGSPVNLNVIYGSPYSADVGDFDADGHADVVVHYAQLQIKPGGLVLFFGNGDGTFDPAVIAYEYPHGPPLDTPQFVRVGDVNGDRLPDIVVTNTPPVFLSNGDRSFTIPPCADCYGFGEAFQLADLNEDGRDDAVTASSVLLAQPSGAFDPPQPLAPANTPVCIALGDLDGDGHVDAALGRSYGAQLLDSDATTGDVLLLRGNGDGSFQQPGVVVSHVPQPRCLALADADLDGRLDLMVAEMQVAPNTLRVLLNHTYAAGSPFVDLGGALAGSNGYPIQLAEGTLLAHQPFAFKLFGGPPSGSAYHVVGLSALNAPFKGGTLIPFPNLLNGPLPLNAQGAISLAANWPAGGSGLTLWLQFWMPQAGGPVGFAASNGIRAHVP